MNIDPITPSILHVTACEIDVSQDLQASQTKSIAQLLQDEEKNPQNQEEQNDQTPQSSGTDRRD